MQQSKAPLLMAAIVLGILVVMILVAVGRHGW
jgi:hypothetical protein